MNNNDKTLWICFPVYNEWPSIENMMKELQSYLSNYKHNYKILICDDGSTDGSLEYIKSLDNKNIILLEHPFNRGLGESIRDIFEYVVQNGKEEDILIRMDGDNTHNPKYISEFLTELDKGFDVVVASRQTFNDKNLSLYRNSLSYFARFFMKIFFKLPNVSEYSGGFRAYKLGVLKKAFEVFGGRFIELGTFGFVCTFEKLVKLNLLNPKFSEIKFVHEYDKKLSSSKMIPWITILGYILLVPLIYFPKTGWRWQIKRLVN